MKRYPLSTPEAFWARVEKTKDCWLWTGAKDRHGYGKVSRGGRTLSTHRVAWELLHGDIPPGAVVMHTCDTPACVRPEHLVVGSKLDNERDKTAKGRRARGERTGRAKLTADEVVAIRAARLAGVSVSDLAAKAGVGKRHVQRLLRGEMWAHISFPSPSPAPLAPADGRGSIDPNHPPIRELEESGREDSNLRPPNPQ